MPFNHDILRAWENACVLRPPLRGGALLSILGDPQDPIALSNLPLGEHDLRLMQLRRRLFGSTQESIAGCPRCGERAEFSFTIDDVLGGTTVPRVPDNTVRINGIECSFRLLTTRDLEAAGAAGNSHAAKSLLLERCVIGATQGGTELDWTELPAAVVDAIFERMAEVDPMADLRFALECPACGESWRARFDVLTCIWTEIDALAQRLLREISALASAYGWAEADILAMSDVRRQIYLEHIGT